MADAGRGVPTPGRLDPEPAWTVTIPSRLPGRLMHLNKKDLDTFRVIVDTLLPAVEGEGSAWTTPGRDLGLEHRLPDVFGRLPSDRDRRLLKLFLAQMRSPAGGLTLFGKPRAFVSLPPEERADIMRRLFAHPLGLVSGGAQSLKTLVALLWVTTENEESRPVAWEAMGYPGPVGEPPPTPKTLETISIESDTTMSCDVVVVGSGAGGGVVAGVLAQAGLDVVMLEAGGYLNESDFTHLEADAYRRMYLDGALNSTADGGMIMLAGATLGGGTVINYTTSFATPTSVREEWDRIGRFSEVFTGEEFAASTKEVENRFDVNTEHGWPSNRDQLMEKGLRELGWHVDEMPRNVRGCTTSDCGYCTMGCRIGAKQSTLMTYLEDAFAAGARIVTGAKVEDLIVANDTATGVVAVSGANRLIVSARAVVLAAGALSTPAVLLKSGRGGPAVGRYLRLHPVTALWARFSERIEPWSGILQARYSDEFANLDGRGYGFKFETAPVHPLFPAAFHGWGDGPSFKRDILGLGHLDVAGILVRDRDHGQVVITRAGRPVWKYSISEYDQAHVREGVRRGAELYAAVGAEEVFASTSRPVRWRPGEGTLDEFVAEVDSVGYGSNRTNYFTFHQMGTARMGSNPALSVTDADNRVHDTRGLYVMDGSCFPSSSGVNPMLTIAALAHRGATKLAATLA